MQQFKGFDGQNQLVIPIIIAVFVVIFSIVYAFLRLRRAGRRAVLITGICDAGKTVVFSRLAYNTFVNSHTSVKENLAHYPPGKAKLQLVDVPGHERVRGRYLEEYKSTSRALIFVIDSNTLQKEIRDVAEYLYNILTDKVIINNCKKILILCNKQDKPMAKDSKIIRSLLEKELGTLRETKGRELPKTDEEGERRVALGKGGSEDFTFAELEPGEVEFAESAAVDREEDLHRVLEWLGAVAL